ncbi:Kinesin-like protein KIN-UA [Sesamum angolense]|uniref:Kinesin-like protein KIN-UA n=1 Tax=Sesamum angolense TaxID=2727404 RepID=A0AAE1W2R9_9LAMI|nr:Kinesin-like protein KIN-UA [Sesamum angolense]
MRRGGTGAGTRAARAKAPEWRALERRSQGGALTARGTAPGWRRAVRHGGEMHCSCWGIIPEHNNTPGASGAIANLAMNEMNQGLITNKGGAKLLADVASKTDDPQTLRMVAGAIANLCGNEKLHVVLKEDGAIKALLGMTRSGNTDVIAQFLEHLSKQFGTPGRFKGRSLLMDDGALPWLVANLNTSSTATRRHMELAVCHLAQNEDNAKDFITSGSLKELIGISDESAREDIRNLAKKTLRSSPLFRAELLAE